EDCGLLPASGRRLATTGSDARWASYRTDRAGRRDPTGETAKRGTIRRITFDWKIIYESGG
ncbi:MAG: hypothetical protein IKE58_11680, partial [Blautia sp.]|nr:hypothetical protein [Blautia sp.]